MLVRLFCYFLCFPYRAVLDYFAWILATINALCYVVIAARWNRLTSIAGCVLLSVVRIVPGE